MDERSSIPWARHTMPYALMAAQAWSRARKVGITLTAAQCVIFAELYWNPGPLIQAEDRAHRIGQKSSVLTRYLISPGSSDDIMWSQVTKKLQVVGKALDGNDESIAGLQLSNELSLEMHDPSNAE
ncbi:TPA: SWI/SNF-related matrix-associated actin-dependent regulator of chromatin subfamily A-like protein 1 [Trebouxia sp. C0004]